MEIRMREITAILHVDVARWELPSELERRYQGRGWTTYDRKAHGELPKDIEPERIRTALPDWGFTMVKLADFYYGEDGELLLYGEGNG
jgi:hypothetical protein